MQIKRHSAPSFLACARKTNAGYESSIDTKRLNMLSFQLLLVNQEFVDFSSSTIVYREGALARATCFEAGIVFTTTVKI